MPGTIGRKTLQIEPGSPWEDGYVESFRGRLRDELLEREVLRTLVQAKVLIELWQRHSNTASPTVPRVIPPGSRDPAALFGCFGYALATARGWSIGRRTPNLSKGTIRGAGHLRS